MAKGTFNTTIFTGKVSGIKQRQDGYSWLITIPSNQDAQEAAITCQATGFIASQIEKGSYSIQEGVSITVIGQTKKKEWQTNTGEKRTAYIVSVDRVIMPDTTAATTVIVGRVGRKEDIKTTRDGQYIINLSVATTDSVRQPDGKYTETTEWHNVTFFSGKQGQGVCGYINQYINIGDVVAVAGTVKLESFTSKGLPATAVKVIGHTIERVGGKGSGGENPTTPTKPAPKPKPVNVFEDNPKEDNPKVEQKKHTPLDNGDDAVPF
jgi:single-strand DNA-binding protein